MENNIKLFDTYTAIILDNLYNHFPVKEDIQAHEFLLENDKEHNEAFLNTMTFLKEEGFITYSSLTFGGTFSMVRLTSKGLSTLGTVPKSLTGSEPIILKIRNALKNGGAEATRSVIQEFIRIGVSGFIG